MNSKMYKLNFSTEGKFPVIMFFPGFACTTNVQDYSRVLSHIASWGYVVIGEICADWKSPSL